MKPKVLVIAGPTASGKTKLSIELAKQINGEIISADSMQIYKGLDIGTAKVTEIEKNGIPHHMIDIKNFNENYNVWQFVNDAKRLIDEIIERGNTPIIVGGTNLYISALTENYDFGKSEIPADAYKPKNDYEFHLFALNLPREKLYERLNNRVDEMIKDGLEEEVFKLRKEGLTAEMQAGRSIGYKELLEYFDGNCTREYAIDKIKQHNRNFAKRQMTWLRSMKNLTWLDALTMDENIQAIYDKIK